MKSVGNFVADARCKWGTSSPNPQERGGFAGPEGMPRGSSITLFIGQLTGWIYPLISLKRQSFFILWNIPLPRV